MFAITFDVSPLCHARAEHFQQCAEFPLLRNHGLGPRRVGSQRLGRSSVVSRNYNKFWPRGLNPLLSTTAFFVCCGMRRGFQYALTWALWYSAPRTGHVARRAQHWRISVMPQQGRGRGAITILNDRGSTNQASHARRLAELLNAEEIERGGHDGDQ